VPPPRRLGARLRRLGEHFARRWGVAWTPRRRLGDALRTMCEIVLKLLGSALAILDAIAAGALDENS
jgi:hypothetical protein